MTLTCLFLSTKITSSHNHKSPQYKHRLFQSVPPVKEHFFIIIKMNLDIIQVYEFGNHLVH